MNVHFKPFPWPAFTINYFTQGFLTGTFPLIFGLVFSVGLFKLTQGLVQEKEKRIKEGMMMMGLKNWVFWASWGITYLIIFFFVTATTVAGMYVNTIYHSDASLLFVWLFGFLCTLLTGGL